MRRIGSWVVGLDDTYQSRVDDGDLVLWKPGRTVFSAPFVKSAATGSSRAHLERILVGAPAARRTVLEREDGDLLRHAYLVRERQEDGHRCWCLSSWTFAGDAAAIGLSLYFDLKRDLAWAVAVAESVRFGADAVAADVADAAGPHGHTALASVRVVGPTRPAVLYAYCEAPDTPEDSGGASSPATSATTS